MDNMISAINSKQDEQMSLSFGSLFAGVGGFDLGFESAGWTCGFQVEWDKHCQQVLAHHWPHVPRWGDVQEVDGRTLPPVDLITFGSPCQDLSVAGKRAGLDGERSGLFFEATRIIKEMRDATGNEFPRWAVWENVAGALSSNKGDDFAAVLDTLADTGALVLEWAILDTRWFGVPQRRRRVFVVACFDSATAARCPDPLLPVASRSGWNPPTGNTPRQDVASTLGGGSGSRGWARDADGNLPPEVWREEHTAPTLNIFDNNSEARATVLAFNPEIVGPLTATGMTRARETESIESHHVIAFSHTQGLDAQPSATAWPTLRAEGGGQAVIASVVRRLTPLECERLMGWPDNHTRYGADGKELADSHRYKMCGNGVVAPVAAWIAGHIRRIEEARRG